MKKVEPIVFIQVNRKINESISGLTGADKDLLISNIRTYSHTQWRDFILQDKIYFHPEMADGFYWGT